MKIEVRADNTTRITGYVNVVERESRPVITARGRVNEVVESGVFRKALEERAEIPMTVDHDNSRVIATTADGTLTLTEDNIGLRAEAVISDEEVAKAAREGKIRGWSFGMKSVKDTLEERAEGLPLRRITGMKLHHVTLSLRSVPFYSATSVEVRAGGEEEEIETRAFSLGDMTVVTEKEAKTADNSKFKERIKKLRGE